MICQDSLDLERDKDIIKALEARSGPGRRPISARWIQTCVQEARIVPTAPFLVDLPTKRTTEKSRPKSSPRPTTSTTARLPGFSQASFACEQTDEQFERAGTYHERAVQHFEPQTTAEFTGGRSQRGESELVSKEEATDRRSRRELSGRTDPATTTWSRPQIVQLERL